MLIIPLWSLRIVLSYNFTFCGILTLSFTLFWILLGRGREKMLLTRALFSFIWFLDDSVIGKYTVLLMPITITTTTTTNKQTYSFSSEMEEPQGRTSTKSRSTQPDFLFVSFVCVDVFVHVQPQKSQLCSFCLF